MSENLEQRIVYLNERLKECENAIDQTNKRIEFMRGALQKNIESQHQTFRDSADYEFFAMLDLVRSGEAYMTVSYSIYPTEKDGENNAQSE